MKKAISTRLPSEYCNLNFKKPVTSWDEGIPLGNGLIGCLIWGTGDALRFSLDRGDIWDKTPYPGVLEEDFTYRTLVDMVKRKDTEATREKFDAPYYNPTPTKLPAGKLVLCFDGAANVQSELELATSQAHIKIENRNSPITIDTFIHARENIGFIKVNLLQSEFQIELKNPEFGVIGEGFDYSYDGENRDISAGSLKQLKYPKPEKVSKKIAGIKIEYFTQFISEELTYGIVVAIKETDGVTQLVYTIINCSNTQSLIEDGISLVLKYMKAGYFKSIIEHKRWWEGFWGKSGVDLPDKQFEKQWYLTNYLFASCSRKNAPPMPLQGVWTADSGELPPWKGDYHNDLNTQMSYYHYLKANHIEEGESFIDFLWNLVPQAEDFAKSFFQTEGLCLPSVMTIDGKPLGGWPMYSLAPTSQMWLCQAFERHYRFTGDDKFLREKAYPYLRESAICILSLMNEEDGKLYLAVSSSPEIHDDTAEAWLTPNSNSDLSMIRYVMIQLIRFAKILGNDESQDWQDALDKLPLLAVNENHVLKLSPDEDLLESHRHFAHAMAIHPLRLLDYEKAEDKIIIDNTIHNLELLGTGMWVGFSFTWMAELYAIQRNGNGAAYQLEVFWRNCCSQNGFHLNGDYKNRGTSQFHYRPFTLEANMCASDALQEMLLQTEDNTINLFPAIPEEWMEEAVGFEHFRAEDGLLVSATMKNGKIETLCLESARDQKIVLKNKEMFHGMTCNIECQKVEFENTIELELKIGECYYFENE